MADCQESIKKLEEKIAEYEGLLGQLLEQPKMVGIITAGPFVSPNEKGEEETYYRVAVGGSEVLIKYKKNILFDAKVKPELEQEVTVLGGAIIGVTPKGLLPTQELPDFELISWDDIGGLRSQVERIREAIEIPMNNAKLAKEFGLQAIKGILLWGPPGCGKTLVAKAIASVILKDTKADHDSFIYVKGAELLDKYVGQTEKSIRAIFDQSRTYSKKTGKKAVVFIDEAEALLPQRGSRRSSDVDLTIVPTFLSEMDGFEAHSPIMILSTNLPQNIDQAILRDGRIDLRIEISRPTPPDTEDIFGIHLKKVKCLDQPKLLSKKAAECLFSSPRAQGVSGAMVANLVKSAARTALTRKIAKKDSKAGVTFEDLEMAIYAEDGSVN